MRNNKNIIESIYILSVIAAFGLLFYANADQQEIPDGTVVRLGIGKLFYLPCGIALACSMLMKTAKDKLSKVLKALIGLAFVSALLHPQLSNNLLTMTLTRFVMAVLCFKDLRHIDPKKFVYYATLASPLIVLPHYFLTNPFAYGPFRYGGFYGDPNFLALALNLISTICYLSFRLKKSIVLRTLATITILSTIPLIFLGASRGGLLGLIVIGFFIFRDLYRANKTRLFLAILLVAIASNYIVPMLSHSFDLIGQRFSEEGMEGQGTTARWIGIQNCLTVFSNKIEFIPFGIGPGNTLSKMAEYSQYGYIGPYVIHNTYFSILYEMGLFVAGLYMYLYIYVFKRLYKLKMYLLFGLLLSASISLFTLPGAAFMPGWILLFFLANNRIIEIQAQASKT